MSAARRPSRLERGRGTTVLALALLLTGWAHAAAHDLLDHSHAPVADRVRLEHGGDVSQPCAERHFHARGAAEAHPCAACLVRTSLGQSPPVGEAAALLTFIATAETPPSRALARVLLDPAASPRGPPRA